MSGVPNMQDIALLHDALQKVNDERRRIGEIKREIAQLNAGLHASQQKLSEADAEVKRLMEAMDCDAPGNYGYPARMMALLTGLAKHAEQYGRIHL